MTRGFVRGGHIIREISFLTRLRKLILIGQESNGHKLFLPMNQNLIVPILMKDRTFVSKLEKNLMILHKIYH